MKQVKFKFPVRMLALFFGLFLSVSAFAQQITVNGHVKDAAGEAVIGATVRVAGTTEGTVTDIDGNFSMNVDRNATLQISYIGYLTKNVTPQSNLVVKLEEDAAKNLSEVVVIGYGRTKKEDLTGSVTALKPDELSKGITNNASDMLVGKIAGVDVKAL